MTPTTLHSSQIDLTESGEEEGGVGRDKIIKTPKNTNSTAKGAVEIDLTGDSDEDTCMSKRKGDVKEVKRTNGNTRVGDSKIMSGGGEKGDLVGLRNHFNVHLRRLASTV